jgi:hypothetical protein
MNLFRCTVFWTLLCCLGLPAAQGEHWITLRDSAGKALKARFVSATDKEVTIERQRDRKTFTLSLNRLSAESADLVKKWREKQASKSPETNRPSLIPEDLPKRLYPRSLTELKKGLAKIQERKALGSYDAEHEEAIRALNSYRFLVGVPSEVTLDSVLNDNAVDAATACEEAGKIAHTIGRSTDRCNIHRGGAKLAGRIKSYIADHGQSNRAGRFHRRWCLNYPMTKSGFGKAPKGRYAAMWVFDKSGSKPKESWSYPSRGLFPLEYLESNAWSLYLTQPAPAAASLTVEVVKLNERPEKPFSSRAEVPGKALPVEFVATEGNAINFEPQQERISEPGIYHVRIKGGGVKEQYLVELFILLKPANASE